MNVNRQDMSDVLTATFGQGAAASWISTMPGMTRWRNGCATRWAQQRFRERTGLAEL